MYIYVQYMPALYDTVMIFQNKFKGKCLFFIFKE